MDPLQARLHVLGCYLTNRRALCRIAAPGSLLDRDVSGEYSPGRDSPEKRPGLHSAAHPKRTWSGWRGSFPCDGRDWQGGSVGAR